MAYCCCWDGCSNEDVLPRGDSILDRTVGGLWLGVPDRALLPAGVTSVVDVGLLDTPCLADDDDSLFKISAIPKRENEGDLGF